MFDKSGSLRSAVLLVCLAVGLAACRAGATPVQSGQPGLTAAITSASCPAFVVKAGDQVVWINQDLSQHVVHAEDSHGQVLFDSGVLRPGDAFAFVFTQAGIYEYRCAAAGSPIGMVTVEP